MRVLSSDFRRASKKYQCDAWHWYCNSSYAESEFDSDDWNTIERARNQGGAIMPGDYYLCQKSVNDDGFQTFRARIDMHEVCLKYNLYPDD